MKKCIRSLITVATFLLWAGSVMGITAFAGTITVAPDEEGVENFFDSIPEEVGDRLPEGYDNDLESFENGVLQMSEPMNAVSVILDIVGAEIKNATDIFALLLAAVLVSAVFTSIGDGADSGALSLGLRFCSVGAVVSVMICTLYSHFDRIETFFDQIKLVVGGTIPITVGIWAMGGNVSTAAVGNATFYVMLNVCTGIYATTVLPVCCILTVLGTCEALSDEIKTGKLINAIKKTYYFILGAVMTLLVSSMAAETALAAAADTAAARTAKVVSGVMIPILGGGVGETFRTLATGVSYLKSIFGIGGIIIVVLLCLPLIVSVLLTRFVLVLSAGIADMLGCGGQSRLFENLCEVYGCILAVVTSVSVMFILSFCIFMQTVVAVA